VIGATEGDLGHPVLKRVEDLLADHERTGIDKLILYARSAEEMPWVRQGYFREGHIERFFADRAPAHLWVRFAGGREVAPDEGDHHHAVLECLAKEPRVPPAEAADYRFRVATVEDVPRLGSLLRTTFEDYPSALDDLTLTEKIRRGHNLFGLLEASDGTLAAIASAEIDASNRSAEMTDCATDPRHRGQGLMALLLWRLEEALYASVAITDLYTLARAGQMGMNSTFSRLGYSFCGRLVNNCRMPTGWESMNVWCRSSAARFEAAPDAIRA
jgi:putative beta-lysine N-acetyltransferase